MKLYWTKESSVRLQEIEDFISRDNPEIAIEFTDKLISIAETIPNNPDKGRIVPELAMEQIREILYKGYRIVYYRKETSIEILTVFEGHQLLKKEEILKNISK
ncbi:MAG: type II toxin-antitoxin system RelE/ParE family toxin [Ignavibacteriaceae bacterium]